MADVAALQQEMFECIQAGDWDRLRELFHPEYQYTDVDGSVGGADEAVAMAKGFLDAFPDLSFTVRSQFGSGAMSCLELTATGTQTEAFNGIPPTGRTVTVNGCNVVEERDGLVYREADYFDTMTLLRQLGVAE